MKNKLINNFTSRPFVVLIIAVIAFFTRPEHFPAWALISAFGLYCGYNVADKFVKGNKFKAYPANNNAPQYKGENIIEEVIERKNQIPRRSKG